MSDPELLDDDQWDAELLIEYLQWKLAALPDAQRLDLGPPGSAHADGTLAADNAAAWSLAETDPRFTALGLTRDQAYRLAAAPADASRSLWDEAELVTRFDPREKRDRLGKWTKGNLTAAAPPAGGAGRVTGGSGDWDQDYAPDTGDGWVPDLTPAKGVKDLTSRGRPDGDGTAADPIDVRGDLDKALALMRDGKHVRLNQVDEVALLLHKVDQIAKRTATGDKKPDWDFGLLTVTGTNLFTAQHKGIPRIKMPQFSGLAEPHTEAARLAGGDGKFVDLAPQLEEQLRAQGIKVTARRVKVAHLRATQTELVGSKVAGFAAACERKDPKALKALNEAIFVTRDGYVIDGHHRWAANMMLDALDGKLGNDTWQNVRVVDMDIGAMIPYSLEFALRMGIATRGAVKRMLEAWLARGQWRKELHPRDRFGQFASKPSGPAPVTAKAPPEPGRAPVHAPPGPANDSLAKYTRPDGTTEPARRLLHETIVAKALAGHTPARHPVATFLGGGTASGKTTVIAQTAGPRDEVHVDVDAIKSQLPEYRDMVKAGDPRAAMYVHEESSKVGKEVTAEAQARHLNLLIDGVGDSDPAKMAAKVDRARAAGYQVDAKYVTVDIDEAIRRAQERARQTGRMVPPSVIRELHASVTDTFKALLDAGKFDAVELWDNNARGGRAKLIGKKPPGAGWTVLDEAAWQRFLAKGSGGGGPG